MTPSRAPRGRERFQIRRRVELVKRSGRRNWTDRFCALGLGVLTSCILGAGGAARAVVIASGDGTGNTSAPPDDPGWASVGAAGGLCGVYLGDRWVLTANHVGERAITFGGITYQPVVGSKIRLMTDPTATADLAVYRIIGRPAVPAVTLAEMPPLAGSDEVTMIGQGWNREATLTEWTSSWSEAPPGPVAYRGYKKSTGRAMRWGRDVVTETDLLVDTGPNTTYSFVSLFEETGGVTDEAHTVEGDSGGAAFAKRNGAWELVGILYARIPFPGQPIDAAVFGNESVMADIAYYRDQILEATAPDIPTLPLPAAVVLAGLLMASARRRLRASCGGR